MLLKQVKPLNENSKYDQYLDNNGLDSNGYSSDFLKEIERVFSGPHQEMTQDDWDDLLGD